MTPEPPDQWVAETPDCARCRSALPEYVAGQLPDPARRNVERHLAACGACRAELAFWQALSDAAQRAPIPTPPHALAQAQQRLLAAVAGATRAERTSALAPALHERSNRPMRIDERQVEYDTAETRPAQTYPAYPARQQQELQQGHWAQGRRNGPSTALRAAVAALVIIALSAALFGYLALQRQSRTANHRQPITPTLTWQSKSLPVGFVAAGSPQSFVVAPGDGNTAYACGIQAPPQDAPVAGPNDVIPALWVTQNRGQSWQRLSIPISGVVGQCSLLVDDGDPQTVQFTFIPSMPYNGPTTFLTRNGGVSWAPADTMMSTTQQLVSIGAAVYALRVVNQQFGLYVSDSSMRSWRLITEPIRAAGQDVQQFWVNSRNGALLAQAWEGQSSGYSGDSAHAMSGELWGSSDGGKTWRLLRGTTAFYVASTATTSHAAWYVCGFDSPSGSRKGFGASEVACSADGGQTWKTYAIGATNRPAQLDEIIGVANDGSVLATANFNGQQWSILRFVPADTQWRTLRDNVPALHQLTYWYAMSTSSGGQAMLWAYPLDMITFPNLIYKLYTVTYP